MKGDCFLLPSSRCRPSRPAAAASDEEHGAPAAALPAQQPRREPPCPRLPPTRLKVSSVQGFGGDARDSKLERLNSSTKRFLQMAT